MAETAHAQERETKTRVFISYSRKDMAFADRLEMALKARGFEVLIDRQEIYAFEDWWKRIQSLIGQADTVIFVLSPDAVKSDVALKEVEYAASLSKRFAPVVCRKVEDSAVPEALRRLNFVFFDEPDRFDTSVEKLAEALRTDIGWVRQHTEYGESERRWSAAGKPRGLLLHSPTLEVAEYWIGSRPSGAPEPTKEIQVYITASRKGERSARRVWRVVLTSTFTFMAATILGLVGWINQSHIADQWHWYTVMRPYATANIWPYVLNAAAEEALKPGGIFRECKSQPTTGILRALQAGEDDCPDMVVVPAGSYTMGGPANVGQPQHMVTIPKPFAVSEYELTFDEWDACVAGGGCNGYKPADQGWGRSRQPAINVDWVDAQQYVAWLSRVTGKAYRLLSEAEYEYAARAGTTTAYPWGDDIKLNGQAMADCNGCGSMWDNKRTAPVGSFPPNKFGLYEMVGNVWEWTEDCVHTNYNGAPTNGSAWLADNSGNCIERVVRGGCWDVVPGLLRSSIRVWDGADNRYAYVGFRVARTLNQ